MIDQELESSDIEDGASDSRPEVTAEFARKAGAGSRWRKRKSYTQAEVALRFQSCGRCGMFLTGYRLTHDPEFKQAITDIEGDWLPLPWAADMRELVNKSYGCRTDIETYYLEGTCPECKRPFAYAEPHPDQPAWFVVKM